MTSALNADNWENPKAVFVALTCAVCLASAIALAPCLKAGAFCYDDNLYLQDNHLVQHPGLRAAWQFISEVRAPSTVTGYYQPLTMISLMMDVAAGGSATNLYPFHRTSLLLHILSAAIIAVLLYELFGPFPACAAALLFAIHPLVIEPLAWIGDRKTLLAAFFSLCSLLSYVYFTRKAGRWRYGLTLLFYMLALLSKPTSTPLPIAMLLLDFWPLKRLSRKGILEKIPMLAVAVISGIVTVISQAQGGNLVTPEGYGSGRIPLVFAYNIVFYIHKMLWPADLSPHYAFPLGMDYSNPLMLAYLLGSITLILLLIVSLRWTRGLMTGWLVFMVMLLPTMQVLQFTNVIASDKYAYLPAIGVLIVIAWALSRIWDRSGRLARTCVMLCILVLAGAEAYGARRQLDCWTDSVTLYTRMAQVTPKAVTVRNNLAIALARKGDLDEAMKQIDIALSLAPEEASCLYTKGSIFADMGQPEEALNYYYRSIKENGSLAGTWYNAGVTLTKLGRPQEAIPYCRRSVELKPNWPKAHLQLGIALARAGQSAEAIPSFEEVIALEPENWRARTELADILVTQTKWSAAVLHYRESLKYHVDYDTLNNLASSLVEAGKLDEAGTYYGKAIALRPENVTAYCNLAVIFAKTGKVEQARDLLTKSLQIDPDNARAKGYLELLGDRK
jgi:protein O-mannosyl-transferase